MPFVNNNGVRIHYEVEGSGTPLVLQHGITRNIERWRLYGYTGELGKDYQLILVDARGHGESDKPHDTAAYRPELMAGDIIAVMDELGVKKAHYYGYSMGAAIGYKGIARYALPRFYSLVLGGFGPYAAFTEAEKKSLQSYIDKFKMAAENGMEAYLAYLVKRDGPLPPGERERQMANDPKSLLAVASALFSWPPAGDILKNIKIPCLCYAGEADAFYPNAKKGAENLPDATFFSLPGLAHSETLARSDLVLPHVKKFLAEVSKNIKS